jgi:hypothetical protein
LIDRAGLVDLLQIIHSKYSQPLSCTTLRPPPPVMEEETIYNGEAMRVTHEERDAEGVSAGCREAAGEVDDARLVENWKCFEGVDETCSKSFRKLALDSMKSSVVGVWRRFFIEPNFPCSKRIVEEEPGVVKLEKLEVCPVAPGVKVELRLMEEPGVEVPPEDKGLNLGDFGVENLLFVVEANPKPLGPIPVADSGKLKKLVLPMLVEVSIPNPAQVEEGRSQLLFLGENAEE